MILKRYPDGIDGPSFFQQNAGANDSRQWFGQRTSSRRWRAGVRFVGGDLATLLYTVQIGTIAVHPWQSRTRTHQYADTTTIDLDPGDDVPFSDVVALAKKIKVELDKMGFIGCNEDIRIERPAHRVAACRRRRRIAEAAQLAERIAERVVEADPDRATIERTIRGTSEGIDLRGRYAERGRQERCSGLFRA